MNTRHTVLDDLPDDMICQIFSFIEARKLFTYPCCVCKRWHDLVLQTKLKIEFKFGNQQRNESFINSVRKGSFNNVTSLDVKNVGSIDKLFEKNCWRSLSTLLLSLSSYKVEDVQVIALSLDRLTKLNLARSKISDEGLKYLSTMPLLKNLNLAQNSISALGMKYIKGMRSLENLCLFGNIIGPSGCKYFVESNLTNLQVLNLVGCKVGTEGAKLIAQGSFSNLKTLALYSDDIGLEAIKLITLNLKHLNNLVLGFCNICLESIKVIARGKLLELSMLNLTGNDVGDEGAQVISRGGLHKLERLLLSHNAISDEGAKFLATSENLPRLSQLFLEGNDITSVGETFFNGKKYKVVWSSQ